MALLFHTLRPREAKVGVDLVLEGVNLLVDSLDGLLVIVEGIGILSLSWCLILLVLGLLLILLLRGWLLILLLIEKANIIVWLLLLLLVATELLLLLGMLRLLVHVHTLRGVRRRLVILLMLLHVMLLGRIVLVEALSLGWLLLWRILVVLEVALWLGLGDVALDVLLGHVWIVVGEGVLGLLSLLRGLVVFIDVHEAADLLVLTLVWGLELLAGLLLVPVLGVLVIFFHILVIVLRFLLDQRPLFNDIVLALNKLVLQELLESLRAPVDDCSSDRLERVAVACYL